jgi:hypothetical protein
MKMIFGFFTREADEGACAMNVLMVTIHASTITMHFFMLIELLRFRANIIVRVL